MFILNNLKYQKPLDIEKINGRFVLRQNSPPVVQFTRQKIIEDKIVLVNTEDKKHIKNIKIIDYCNFFELSTMVMQKCVKQDKPLTLRELYTLHGSKRMRIAINKAERDDIYFSQNKNNNAEYNGNEKEVVPPVNTKATKIDEIYRLKVMFGNKLLKDIKKIEHNYQSVRTVNYRYEKKYKAEFIILDTILYILSKKCIPDQLPYGDISERLLKNILFPNKDPLHGRTLWYNQISKCKLIAMACVMMLKIKNYEVTINEIPDFGIADHDVRKIFKLLGCSYVNNKFKLVKIPQYNGSM